MAPSLDESKTGDWRWVNASISTDGSTLLAVYEFRPRATRTKVSLARDKFRTVRARTAEIHRQLGIGTSDEGNLPQAS